jgi:ubiquinone/menaquinone biosynthesis C-methylase UbiE
VPPAGFRFLTPIYDALCAVLGFGAGFRRWLLELAQLRPEQRVLDVGCGTGTLAVLIKETYPNVRVDAVDPEPGALAIARRKAARRELAIPFLEASAGELPFASGVFDKVLCTLVLHHMADESKETSLREMRRVLRPGGELVLADFETTRGWLFGGKRRSCRSLEDWLRLADFAPTPAAVRRGVHVWRGRVEVRP